jgi:hypothetical protein
MIFFDTINIKKCVLTGTSGRVQTVRRLSKVGRCGIDQNDLGSEESLLHLNIKSEDNNLFFAPEFAPEEVFSGIEMLIAKAVQGDSIASDDETEEGAFQLQKNDANTNGHLEALEYVCKEHFCDHDLSYNDVQIIVEDLLDNINDNYKYILSLHNENISNMAIFIMNL